MAPWEGYPSERGSNAESVSMAQRHYAQNREPEAERGADPPPGGISEWLLEVRHCNNELQMPEPRHPTDDNKWLTPASRQKISCKRFGYPAIRQWCQLGVVEGQKLLVQVGTTSASIVQKFNVHCNLTRLWIRSKWDKVSVKGEGWVVVVGVGVGWGWGGVGVGWGWGWGVGVDGGGGHSSSNYEL